MKHSPGTDAPDKPDHLPIRCWLLLLQGEYHTCNPVLPSSLVTIQVCVQHRAPSHGAEARREVYAAYFQQERRMRRAGHGNVYHGEQSAIRPAYRYMYMTLLDCDQALELTAHRKL